jgi:hypothetical protein
MQLPGFDKLLNDQGMIRNRQVKLQVSEYQTSGMYAKRASAGNNK